MIVGLVKRVIVILRNFAVMATLMFPINACAESNDTECAFEKTILENTIGPLEIGMTFDSMQVENNIKPTLLPYSDVDGYEFNPCGTDASIIVETDEAENIITLSTTSVVFKTSNGASVDMNLTKLRELYPNGTFSTGVEEGGWIAFKPNDLSGYFEFELDGVGRTCLRDISKCATDFYERKSIRYWVTN